MAQERLCSIDGCCKPFVAKRLCRMHYGRLYTKGTVHIDPKPSQLMLGFVENVALKHEGDECLIHPFKLMNSGYAWFSGDGFRGTLHRYVCEKAHGSPPHSNCDAAHECGNRRCLNPRHLAFKTRINNIADKRRHGTHLVGEDIPYAILTEEQVLEIRALYGFVQQKDIAKRFGVSKNCIWHIVHRNTWKHI